MLKKGGLSLRNFDMGFVGPLYYTYNKGPQCSLGNYLGGSGVLGLGGIGPEVFGLACRVWRLA